VRGRAGAQARACIRGRARLQKGYHKIQGFTESIYNLHIWASCDPFVKVL